MENKEDILFDVPTRKICDLCYYFSYHHRFHFIELCEVRSENIYKDGVEVHGEGWRLVVVYGLLFHFMWMKDAL